MRYQLQRFQPRRRQRPPTLWRLLVLLLATGLLAACAGAEQGGDEGEAGISVGAVLADPERYQGQQLTLSGEVGESLSMQVFRMTDAEDGLFSGNTDNEGLLVVIADGAQRPPDIDSKMLVQVTGEVRAYDIETLEPDIGTSFVPAVEGISEGDPLLLAERVLVQATISAIDANPGAYLHNEVTVTGRVAEIVRAGIVRLEDAEGGDILVVVGSAEQQRAVDSGQELVVTGQVRQFNLEEIGGELELDLDDGVFAGWSNRVVIMAETVE